MYIWAYLTMIGISTVATLACIPPYIQCKKEDNKACKRFSVCCFILMLYITIRLIIAMIQYA